MDEAALAAGERLFDTVEHGDLEELWQIFGDGALVWHNTDEKLVTVAQSIDRLRELRDHATEFRYTDVKRLPTPTGFVQQHTLLITFPDGTHVRDLAACLCDVVDGRITRMDAYHDSAAFAALAPSAVARG